VVLDDFSVFVFFVVVFVESFVKEIANPKTKEIANPKNSKSSYLQPGYKEPTRYLYLLI
jgi:hypothetical protein